jgi:thiamine-monophosphate kinase
MSPAFQRLAPAAERLRLQAAAGDDYELCVCLPPQQVDAARRAAADAGTALSVVGEITAEPGLRWIAADGSRPAFTQSGYRHFPGRSQPRCAAHTRPHKSRGRRRS